MKKSWLILCIVCLFFAVFYTFYHKEQAVSFVTDVTIAKDGNVSFLQNRTNDSVVYELNKQNDIQNTFFVKSEIAGTKAHSTNIVKDGEGNTYVLLQERLLMGMEIQRQYVSKYDKEGVFQQTLFVCDIRQEEHQNHILKNLQYSEKENVIVSFLIEDDNTVDSMFYDVNSKNTWTKTYQFDKKYTIREILYDGDGGIYFTTPFSELYFVNKQNELSQITLPVHCVPYKLSIDEQNEQLYFNDIHHFCFVKYDIKKEEIETIYEEKQMMSGDISFDKIRDLKYEKGSFLASTPLYETEQVFFYVAKQQKGHTVFTMTKTTAMLLKYGIKCFVIVLLFCSIVWFLWYIWCYSKKILLRLGMIMIILLLGGSSCIGIVFYEEIFEKMTDEVYMQLYSISTLIANNIDGDDLEQAVFPQKEGDMFYDTLTEKMYLDMEAFYEQNNNAMRKHIYYTLYFAEGDNFYVGIDSTTITGEGELSNTNEKYITSIEEINRKRKSWDNGEAVMLLTSDMTEEWLFTASPIYNSKGELVGAFDVGLNKEDVVVYMAEVLLRTAKVTLVVAMILIVVTTLFLRQFLKGIVKLKKCVDSITEGDWNVTAQINSHDELEEIGNAFNRMVYRIKCFLDAILQMNTACERFLPLALFQKMGKENITELELGDQIMLDIYILTIKVSNFYDMTKDMTTDKKFKQINEILALFSGVVGESNGVIESYQNAGIRVIYTNKAEDAIDTALRVAEKIEWYQNKIKKEIELTMTLQYDDTMLGIVGDEKHMAISLVSKSIDLIYDMEKYAEENGIVLIMTEGVVKRIEKENSYSIRKLTLPVQNDMVLFDCVNAYHFDKKELKKESLMEFIKGAEYCSIGDFEQARKHFVMAIRIAPNDIVTKKHIFYCDKMIEQKNKIVIDRRKLVK